LPAESITYLLDNYPDAYAPDVAERLRGVAAGNVEVFVPEATITRSDGNPSLVLQVFKNGDANTVKTFKQIDQIMETFSAENNLDYLYAFEQSTFIEDSINGVTREGAMGALFAILVILLFLSGRIQGKYKLSWRATLITGLSIPASVLFALLLMWLVPRSIGPWLNNSALDSDNFLLTSLAKLFPAKLTLNIMTLSGLTVAIGRVVDDSIVVLENSYRHIQKGENPVQAVYRGTREVAVAIFAATVTTMAVFLPIGFVGGVISEFFLPFGLAVTYALIASYSVSITVVPALTAMLIRRENIPEEVETAMQRGYTPILEWVLQAMPSKLARTATLRAKIADWFKRLVVDHRIWTMALATAIFVGSLGLLTQLPNSFIPGLGDPTINVTIERDGSYLLAQTDQEVRDFEQTLASVDGLKTILSEVGSAGGRDARLGRSGVTQNAANLTITIEDGADIDALSAEVRDLAQAAFGEENVLVTAAVQSGFNGFSLIVTGDSLDEMLAVVDDVQTVLSELDADLDGKPDLINVGSNAEAA
ncbi:MAG TPA: efflux RND transporter permease subunit, partial [Anaerolineae bacterium]|nr:efflux RND transporter permease subunit [Anaerolineae bacterium]